MNLNPTKNRVIITPIVNEAKTESGILLPGASETNSDFAEVVACGSEVKAIKVGNIVVYNDNVKKISSEGEDYLILNEDDILAVRV